MRLSTQTDVPVAFLGFEKGITTLKNAGYDCLDLSLFEMSSNSGGVYLGDDWKKVCEERKKFCDDLGITFSQSHTPFSFKWYDEQIKNEIAQPRVLRALEVSGIFGINIAVVHPIHWMEYKGNEEEVHKINVEYYRSMIPYCKEYGVKIAAENMWRNDKKRGYITDDAASRGETLARLVDEVDSEWVTACLDLGHCGLVGDEAQNAIRVLGHNRLSALHVHDNDYKHDAHTLPGLGRMDWEEICKALGEIDYKGDFTYEADNFLRFFPEDFFPKATSFMVEMGRYLVDKIDSYRTKK